MVTEDVFGLVLTGGQSKRMKTDKAMLDFHGKPQYEHAFELLENVCNQVYLSVRNEEAACKFLDYPTIVDDDKFKGAGPLSGILSAFQTHSKVAWLVLAIDLPFVDLKALEYLLNARDPNKYATAFKSATSDLPEPVCAIYEPASFEAMKDYYLEGGACPRKFLMNHETKLIEQINPIWLNNVNSPEEYKDALDMIGMSQ